MKNIENPIYWKFQEERILLRGIAVERAVQLRIERDIAPRFSLTSDRFEGPRIAVADHIARIVRERLWRLQAEVEGTVEHIWWSKQQQ